MASVRDDVVTVVSGLPRSGTSMLVRMLDRGGIPALTDGVRAADEDNPHGYFELEAVKRTRTDPSWVADARGRCVKVVSALLRDLPRGFRYRVVFVERDLAEVVRSQEVMLRRRGAPPGEGAAVWIDRFSRHLAAIEAWLDSEPPSLEVCHVAYRALVTHPQPIVARLDTFLGGGLDTAAMIAAIDPLLYRQR